MDLQIEQLGVRIEDLADKLEQYKNDYNAQDNTILNDIKDILYEIAKLQSEDNALHNEINILNAEDIATFKLDTDTAIKSIEDLILAVRTLVADNAALEAQDVKNLHQEIHTVANEVDDHEVRITTLENGQQTNKKVLDDHIADNAKSIDELHSEDNELHQEIHTVSDNLDNLKSRLDNIGFNSFPWLLISEEQYEKIDNPTKGTFYFIYDGTEEEEESIPTDDKPDSSLNTNTLRITGVTYLNNILSVNGKYSDNTLII